MPALTDCKLELLYVSRCLAAGVVGEVAGAHAQREGVGVRSRVIHLWLHIVRRVGRVEVAVAVGELGEPLAHGSGTGKQRRAAAAAVRQRRC